MNDLKIILNVMLYIIGINYYPAKSALYPYSSETRDTKSLDGLWYFSVLPKHEKLETDIRHIKLPDDMKMPVPSSFNDITTNSTIRDHIGVVFYWRNFYFNKKLDDERVFIYFGGVHYLCNVWVNDIHVGKHKGGHIAFSMEVTHAIKNGKNSIKVAVNNTLTEFSLPQGYLELHKTIARPEGFTVYGHRCDYFDYAGINRPVTLYTTYSTYVRDIVLETKFKKSIGVVHYEIDVVSKDNNDSNCRVSLLDKHDNNAAESDGCKGILKVNGVNLWWPIMSGHTPGYMYKMEVRTGKDIYRLPVGIRTVKWQSNKLRINNEHIYLHGFGMHEDADIRGRGFDNVILLRDMNIIKWLGVNAIRTSHYPYSDEFLNEADEMGLLVIAETPACSLDTFNDELLKEHKRVLREIMHHHRNRPSVFMWSLANEPESGKHEAGHYFSELRKLTKSVDSSRPVTFVTPHSPENDKAARHMDVICVNRYNGWYSFGGDLSIIQSEVIAEMKLWHKKFSKPVIVTEYGAGSIAGQHNLPAFMWSEDYQVLLLQEHFKAFDHLRKEGFFYGEMIWNYIDFYTPQEYNRPGKCAKGLFTRDRQPKAAAFIVKQRYHSVHKQSCADNTTSVCDNFIVNYVDEEDMSVSLV